MATPNRFDKAQPKNDAEKRGVVADALGMSDKPSKSGHFKISSHPTKGLVINSYGEQDDSHKDTTTPGGERVPQRTPTSASPSHIGHHTMPHPGTPTPVGAHNVGTAHHAPPASAHGSAPTGGPPPSHGPAVGPSPAVGHGYDPSADPSGTGGGDSVTIPHGHPAGRMIRAIIEALMDESGAGEDGTEGGLLA